MPKREGIARRIFELIPAESRALISGRGDEVVRRVGLEVIRDIVGDVLCGKNLRDSTEVITRKRLASINAATLVMFIRGEALENGFVQKLPKQAVNRLRQKARGDERQILQWLLGLTTKATQNVLRDDPRHLDKYLSDYIKTCEEVISESNSAYGQLSGSLSISPHEKADINWGFMVELLQTIGAQTLAIRGSEKSTYGKLFEPLILGSLLSILGFEFVQEQEIKHPRKVFWLSSSGEKRESDATALYEAGQGIRFDIGFIGRGNPEISLDKVSRFEREIEIGRSKWFLATIILCDTIGKGSRINQLAERINGNIVQMSMTYWPKEVASVLHEKMGYSHEILKIKNSEIQRGNLSKPLHSLFLAPNKLYV